MQQIAAFKLSCSGARVFYVSPETPGKTEWLRESLRSALCLNISKTLTVVEFLKWPNIFKNRGNMFTTNYFISFSAIFAYRVAKYLITYSCAQKELRDR